MQDVSCDLPHNPVQPSSADGEAATVPQPGEPGTPQPDDKPEAVAEQPPCAEGGAGQAAAGDAQAEPDAAAQHGGAQDAAPHDEPPATPTLADVVERLDALDAQFKAKIARSAYEEQVLKRYSDEIHDYKSDVYGKITLPLLKEIIGVRDVVCDMVSRARDQETAVSVSSVEFIADMLETALDNYSVTIRPSQPGKKPEPGVDRPVGRVKTGDRAKHGTIAQVANDAYLLEGRCIAPAKVKVYVFDEALEEPGAAEPCGGAEASGGQPHAADSPSNDQSMQ